eukprot:495000_1
MATHSHLTLLILLSKWLLTFSDFTMDNIKVAIDDINAIDFLNSNYSSFKVVIAPSAIKYSGNPVLTATEPWEKTLDNGYANIVFDPNNSPKWQLWYAAFIYYNDWKGINNSATLYATSDDGINWTKPKLNLITINSSNANNAVCKGCHGWGVWRDKQDNNTYKMFGAIWRPEYNTACNTNDNCTVIGISTDGIRWNKFKQLNLGNRWDTHNIMFYDPSHNNYKGYSRDAEFPPRIISRMEANKSKTFFNTEYWYMPNDNEGITMNDQLHDQIVMPWHSIYLAFLTVFKTENPNQVTDCALGWSSNTAHGTKTWFRLGYEQSIIKRNVNSKDFDSHLCFAGAFPVDIPGTNTTRFYYQGANNTFFPGTDRQSALGFATIRKDGWAGLTNSINGEKAVLVSHSFTVDGKYFIITIDVYKVYNGSVRIGFKGVNGFQIDDCVYINNNVTNYIVKWKSGSDISSLKGRKVQAQFELNDAVLYTFGTVNSR